MENANLKALLQRSDVHGMEWQGEIVLLKSKLAKLEKVTEAAMEWCREYKNPVPDAVMRRATREKLIREVAALQERERGERNG